METGTLRLGPHFHMLSRLPYLHGDGGGGEPTGRRQRGLCRRHGDGSGVDHLAREGGDGAQGGDGCGQGGTGAVAPGPGEAGGHSACHGA